VAKLDGMSNTADPFLMWQGNEIDAEAQSPEKFLAADRNLRKRLCKCMAGLEDKKDQV
jgi:hypothetical protein